MDILGFIPYKHGHLELKTVPIPVASLIWEYLDVEGMSTLFATFDKSIQRQLASSRAISFMEAPQYLSGPARYFLRSARNVGTVRLGFDVGWRLPAFELLPSLSPASLIICSESVSQFINKDLFHAYRLESLEKDLQNEDDLAYLERLKRCFTRDALPNFAYLSPALRSLKIACDPNDMLSRRGVYKNEVTLQDDLSESLLLPSTLNSLTIENIIFVTPNAIFGALPPGLTALHLSFSISTGFSLRLLLQRFPQLQSLELLATHFYLSDGDGDNEEGSSLADSNLTNLRLGSFDNFPLPLLQSGLFLQLPLERLRIEASPYLTTLRQSIAMDSVDLSLWLPTSLTALHLTQNADRHYSNTHINISRLPPKLTEATIELGTFDTLLIPAAIWLPHLTTLRVAVIPKSRVHLNCCNSAHAATSTVRNEMTLTTFEAGLPTMLPLDVSALPRGLTSLTIDCRAQIPLLEDEARLLPESLTALFLARCDLAAAVQLRSIRPNCSIIFLKPLNVWHSENATILRSEREHLWSPVLDCQAFEHHVLTTYNALRIFLRLDWDVPASKIDDEDEETHFFETTALIWHPTAKRQFPSIDHQNAFPVYDFIKESFPYLTKLVLKPLERSDVLSIFSASLPAALTHLELAKVDICYFDCMLPYSLTYIKSDSKYHSPMPTLHLQDFPNLNFLDAPLWKFWLSDLLWSDPGMDTFSACIAGLSDTMVVRFLRDLLTPHTRLNAALSFDFYETGRLLDPQDDLSDSESMDVDGDSVERSAIETLRLVLSAPIEELADKTQPTDVPIDRDTIGRPVTSLNSLGKKKVIPQPKPAPEFIPRKITMF